MIRKQTLTIVLNGKSEGDISSALDEALKVIKTSGCDSGFDCNDSGSYSYEVKKEFNIIEVEEITEEAVHIASQLKDITELKLIDFAISPEGLSLDDFGGWIPGNIDSMVQILIDEEGGIDNEGDETVVERLSEFLELDSPLTTLNNDSSMKP